MNNTTNIYVEAFEAAHRHKRAFTFVLCALALIVALAVTWQFKIIGISIAGDANVSDSSADVETPTQWEKTLPALTDDWKQNAADIALSQVGYAESTKNFIMADDGQTPKGYTRYGAWFGSQYNDWDAMFASFCLHYAGVPQDMVPRSLGAYSWASAFSQGNMLYAATSYTPVAGDLAFFDINEDQRVDAVGVVCSVSDSGVMSFVQGDVDGSVQMRQCLLTDATLFGIGEVPQNPQVLARGSLEDDEEAEGQSSSTPATDAGSAATSDSASTAAMQETKAGIIEAITDDPTKTTIAVCADWAQGDGDAPDSVSMALVQDGDPETSLQTITLSSANDWQGAFGGVALRDDADNPISYHVVASSVEGFDVEASASTVDSQALAEVSADDSSLAQLAKAETQNAETGLDLTALPETALSADQEGGSLSSERAGLMLFSFTPAVYAADDSRAAATTVPLTITKEWSDGNDNHNGESVTMNVTGTYSDGTSWSVSNVSISSADGWIKTVGIPTQGKTIASCLVREQSIEGYDSYADDVVIDQQTVWVPVAPGDLNDMDVYALTYPPAYSTSYVYALYDTGSASIGSHISYKGTGTVTVDGKEYYDYLTNVSDDAQWRWLSIDSGTYAGYHVLATNSSVANYQSYNSWRFISEVYNMYSGTNAFTMVTGPDYYYYFGYTSDKYLRAAYSSHYMAYESNSVSNKSYASKYTFYKKATSINGMSTTVHNRKTAAENESSTSVTINKVWLDKNGNVDNVSHADDSVTLRLTDADKGGEVVSGAAPAVLSAANGWHADDVWQNLPEGSYSVVEEAVPGYNATVESVQDRKTIWIPVDDFDDGGIYAIADSAAARFLEAPNPTSTSGSTVDYLKSTTAASRVNVQTGALDFGGHQYSSFLNDSDVPVAAQWTAFEKEGRYSLRSSSMNGSASGWWMYFDSSDKCLWAAGSSSVFTYDSATNKLSAWSSSGLTSYAVGTSSVYSSRYGYNGNTYRKMQLYKRITLVDRTYTVTNAPIVTQSGEEAGIKVDHAKYIDALRDGVSNPDTSFAPGTDLTDLYRLYLDGGPANLNEPVDLLLVLDDSGSMKNTTSLNGTDMSRTQALKTILTGSNGVISKFLAANGQNRVAVVKFAGSTPVYSTSYANDASTLSGWTRSVPSLNGLVSSGGTDYSAGLLEAQKLMASNSGNKKIMVFLSDGVPTFYVDANGVRHGHGWSDKGNATSCIEPSMQSFDRFQQACPGVITYAIGFSEEIAGNIADVSSNPVVLRYYAEEGNGAFIQAKNADTLNEQISKLILGGGLFTNASITDTLSDAVDLYDQQPDFKVVMQKVDQNGTLVGQPEVLWNNNGAQKQFVDEATGGDSKDIISSVSYDAATRTVTALFNPQYPMDPECRYTVSFNVRTTEKAYSDYVKNIAAGNDQYNGVEGDPDTDYSPRDKKINQTSSEKPGFYSNTTASLNFKRGNGYYSMDYDMPVVQVGNCSFDIKKVDVGNDSTLLGGAKFSVYRKARTGETVWQLDGLEGDYHRVKDNLVTQGGIVTVSNLEPGTYWVVEEEPPAGYTLDPTPHEITLTRDAIVVGPGDTTATFEGNTNGHLVLKISNKAGYTLPHTGGIGDGPFTATGMFLLATSLAIGCVLARKARRKEVGACLPE